MYHVFYVNDGYMLALDLAPVGCFRDLHEEIHIKTGVLPKDQVFFLNGGEALIGDYLLSNYSDVGTEANPVFFIKRVSSDKDPINSREKEGINSLLEKWKNNVEVVNQFPVKSTVITKYVDLSKEGLSVSDTLIRYCAKIVTEHQYLNHGWLAVTRNLDENINQLSLRYTKASRIAQKLPVIKKKGKIWVSEFERVFNTMSKIKILPNLLSNTLTSSTSEPMSLYDWVSSHDSESTLEELIEHVSEQVDKLDDAKLAEANNYLKTVKEMVNKRDYKDIRGIDKRLVMLENKLYEIEEGFNLIREELLSKMDKAQSDTHNYRVVIAEQKELISKLSVRIEDCGNIALTFLGSKMELLKNVRQRLGGWIRQCYDKLQRTNTNLIIFEKKFAGFRQRLDLVRQIRESPILYVAGIAEVIRRHKFKTEFDQWINIFSQKASEFLKEENTTRAEFYVKLERHFLRELFINMGDELPNFTPTKQKFDSSLPQIGHDELRALRELMKDCTEMSDLFKITTPQVFTRLSVEDPLNPTMSRASLHREASFFTKEQTRTIEDMGKKFPSTNWLTEEGPVEQSPSTQSFLSRTLGSTTSLNVDSQVTTPSDLVPTLDHINIMRRDSSTSEMAPSSVDLTCPLSIHPDRYPKVTSPMKIRRISRGSTPSFPSLDREYPKPIFEEGVPVDSPPDDGVFMPVQEFQQTPPQQSVEQDTPLYTPNLSPVKSRADNEEKSCQTKYDDQEDAATQIGRQRMDSCTQFEYHFHSVDTQAEYSNETVGVQSVAELAEAESQTDALTLQDQIGTEIVDGFKHIVTQFKSLKDMLFDVTNTTTDDIEATKSEMHNSIDKVLEKISGTQQYKKIIEEFEQKVAGLETEKAETYAKNVELEAQLKEQKEVTEREKYIRKEKESEIMEKETRLKALNNQVLEVIKEKEENQTELLKVQQENRELKANLDVGWNEDCLNIELDVVKELLKRELKDDEIDWIKQEIEKRKVVKKTDEKQIIEDKSRTEYENAYKNKMAFLLKGIEDKKNAELAKMREEIEKEAREEYEVYIKRMKSRIDELEDKVRFYEKSCLPSSTSIISPGPMDESIMEQSCMVVEEDVDNTKASSSTLSQTDQIDIEGECEKDSSSPDQALVISPDVTVDVNMNSDTSTNEANTQTKLKLNDMKMMLSLHDVSEGSGVLLVYNDQHASFMVFSTTGTLYFVKQRSLRRLGIDPNNPTPKFTLLFARVLGVELCETKKAPNRYNLAANTRFYRIDVAPMPSSMAGLTLQISAAPPKTTTASTNSEEAKDDTVQP
ncbi:unnamed protein product [Bursaphelenchus okinawaensis]|uniref:Autophagy-related protein 11 C-terminal domain-containing protein n=1 Tax=Bursaphelenchus okinawaensis TaxID=465554 RepID=A0A811KFW8_9BILA|nr:unnamed protein product [Bursaphelenchus okinawaensis]CAG9103696.1 unnamed protein product [Bursaphelenchus okinawaensis]